MEISTNDNAVEKVANLFANHGGGRIIGKVGDLTLRIYALSVEHRTRSEIASSLGIKESSIRYHQNKLEKARAIERINIYPVQFSKGRFSRYWDEQFANSQTLVEGVVETPPDSQLVGLEQLQFVAFIMRVPKGLPPGESWKWGATPCFKPKPIPLDGTHATFTFMGKPFSTAKIQLEAFPIPPTEIHNHKAISSRYIAQAIKVASKTWGFAFFNFIQSTTDPEFTFEVGGLQKIDTGEVQLTKHYKLNDSPIDGKRGIPKVETKSVEHAKALAERGEAVVRLENWVKENRNGILGLAKRMDSTEKTILERVDDKIAHAIEEFGTIITNAFDKLPDSIAKKLNKTYESEEEELPGYL